jgi:hypothetical protein
VTVGEDIVERLRYWYSSTGEAPFELMLEAAAEIERLRALVRELQADVTGGKSF